MSHYSKKKTPIKRSVKKQKKSSKSSRKWSLKYKRSINCKNPRGFSQKQYCKKKSRQKKSRQKKSRQKKSRGRYVKKSKKRSRRRTAAADENSDDVINAVQALLTISGININQANSLPPLDFFSTERFKKIFVRYIWVYFNHSDPNLQYLTYPPIGTSKPHQHAQGLEEDAIKAIGVSDEVKSQLQSIEYKKELSNLMLTWGFVDQETQEPAAYTDTHFEKALKSAIWEYHKLAEHGRSVEPTRGWVSQLQNKLMTILSERVGPAFINVLSELPIMVQLDTLYKNIIKINVEAGSIFFEFIEFYKKVIITLIQNVGQLGNSATNFLKLCLIAVFPILLTRCLGPRILWRAGNLHLFVNILTEVIKQMNIFITDLTNNMKGLHADIIEVGEDAIIRMNSRLKQTGRVITRGADGIETLIGAPVAAATSAVGFANSNAGLNQALGPNILGAAQNNVDDYSSVVTAYLNMMKGIFNVRPLDPGGTAQLGDAATAPGAARTPPFSFGGGGGDPPPPGRGDPPPPGRGGGGGGDATTRPVRGDADATAAMTPPPGGGGAQPGRGGGGGGRGGGRGPGRPMRTSKRKRT